MMNDGRIGYRELINFFKESARKLDANGEEDCAFYFEQVSAVSYTHLTLPTN